MVNDAIHICRYIQDIFDLFVQGLRKVYVGVLLNVRSSLKGWGISNLLVQCMYVFDSCCVFRNLLYQQLQLHQIQTSQREIVFSSSSKTHNSSAPTHPSYHRKNTPRYDSMISSQPTSSFFLLSTSPLTYSPRSRVQQQGSFPWDTCYRSPAIHPAYLWRKFR